MTAFFSFLSRWISLVTSSGASRMLAFISSFACLTQWDGASSRRDVPLHAGASGLLIRFLERAGVSMALFGSPLKRGRSVESPEKRSSHARDLFLSRRGRHLRRRRDGDALENGIVHIGTDQEESTTHLQNCEILWRFHTEAATEDRAPKLRLLKPKSLSPDKGPPKTL